MRTQSGAVKLLTGVVSVVDPGVFNGISKWLFHRAVLTERLLNDAAVELTAEARLVMPGGENVAELLLIRIRFGI